MAFYFESWWNELFVCIFLGFAAYYVYFKIVICNYWKSRNIPYEEPVFILGNLWRSGITDNFANILNKYYRKWKDERMVGIWAFSKPLLIVTDRNIIKDILVKSFSHFRDHGDEIDFEQDPMMGNLFNLTGAKWRNLRVKLTPTFTSGKMKMMLPTMLACGTQLQNHLIEMEKLQSEIEIKDILSRFTMDMIASCAFGIETNSLKNPNSEFLKHGGSFFKPGLFRLLSNLLLTFNPKLAQFFRIKVLEKESADFFLNTVKDVIEYREKNQVERKDFMQLLIQLKNKGELDYVDEIVPDENGDTKTTLVEDMKFGIKEAAAQAFVFFIAGFEISSTALAFCLYELALNTDIQETLQREIDEVVKKHNDQMTYEAFIEMEYLEWVIHETLRKHLKNSLLARKCNEDYKVPDSDIVIEKGTQILLPTGGIHMDPDIFPNPEKFDPLRFSPEEKAKRDNFTALYFGEGPRVCIGNRFAILQMKVGLAKIMESFSVKVSKSTPIPLVFSPRTLFPFPVEGICLKFVLRNK